MPMPSSFLEWPSSKQVQQYLEMYTAKHKLWHHIHLSSEVTSIERPAGRKRGWTVHIDTFQGRITTQFDHVVVANGTFSQGLIPDYPGIDEFKQAGGIIGHTSDYNQLGSMTNKQILVVGYGRSSCDIANAVSDESTSTTIIARIARKILWKLTRKIFNILNYKFLLLTRLGESLFKYIDPSPMESFLHGWGDPIRRSLFGSLGSIVKQQLSLVELNLVPEGGFERIASSTISLSTEGFYEKVKKGDKLTVKKGTSIENVFAKEVEGSKGLQPMALLSSGEQVAADVIICGAEYHQRAPFLPKEIIQKLTDSEGNWIGLYRHILPIGIDDLTFNGYNSSLFCATSSEVASLWIAAHLEGGIVDLPLQEEQAKRSLARFHWLDEKAHGKTAHGTNTVPFSLRPIDDLLVDMQIDIPFTNRFLQWLLPVNPGAYRTLNPQLQQKIASKRRLALDKKVKSI